MSTQPRILVVDDEPSLLGYIRTLLEVSSYSVETASSGVEAVNRIQRGLKPDLVLLDMLMPGMDGIGTLEQLRAINPGMKIVMLSCVSDSRRVAETIRLGAQDYLTKPFQKADLDAVLGQCFRNGFASEEPVSGPGDVVELSDDVFFVAASAAMRKIRKQVSLVANVDIPVLLLGESGSGKEVVAHLIHSLSTRAHRTFMKVNCAALPGDLLESELFGYEPGAFTGATRPKPGKFELCNKGTILLDEIGEMPATLQAKLLHVLQDQQFSRLGGRSAIKVDVRILAATNIDVQQAIATKKLREDLYYRLNAFTVKIPPLRERREEIPLLLRHFMNRLSERFGRAPLPISAALQEACVKYPWPGNLRELGNFVKRYIVLAEESLAISELGSGMVSAASVPAPARVAPAADHSNDLKSLVRGLKDEAEMQAIKRALEQTKWKRKEAAELLHISYKALLYKIRQYGIDPSRPNAPVPGSGVELPAAEPTHAAPSSSGPRMAIGDHSPHTYAES
jgi:two-component system, NtrC family, response regulator AtoC